MCSQCNRTKQNGDVRICIDLTKLNTSVKRETYAMPTVEETLSRKMSSPNLIQTRDFIRSGLTRRVLSFSISSVPKYFQKKMDNILHGLEGVPCHMDHIPISGKDKHEHDTRLKQVLGLSLIHI